MLYYFSVSMWHWRGMVELGRLLNDYPTADPADAIFAAKLLTEATAFKKDIDAALELSAVRTANGSLWFIPAAVVPAGTKPPPYNDMTYDVSGWTTHHPHLSARVTTEVTTHRTPSTTNHATHHTTHRSYNDMTYDVSPGPHHMARQHVLGADAIIVR